MRWWVCLALLAGCDRVFGLEGRMPDAAPIDAPPDVLPANCRVGDQVALSADTYLSDGVPKGDVDVMLATGEHPALMKFILDRALVAGEHVVAATLQLQIVESADGCGPACGPCMPNTATHVSVYWNTTDWSQRDATDSMRDDVALWEQPFSVGPTDRSGALLDNVELPAYGAGPLVIPIPEIAVAQQSADPWVDFFNNPTPMGRLAIQLRADGLLAIATENRADGSCNDGRGEATIRLTVCQTTP